MSCIRRQAAKAGVSVLAALLGSTVLLTPTAGAAPAVRAPMPGAVPGADGRAGVRVGGSVTEIESRREAQNALRTDRLVVIDGYRVLCAPCKAMDFVYEKYARNYPRADFYRFDADTLPLLASAWGVRATPTFCLFRNGTKVDQVTGAAPELLRKAIERQLKEG